MAGQPPGDVGSVADYLPSAVGYVISAVVGAVIGAWRGGRAVGGYEERFAAYDQRLTVLSQELEDHKNKFEAAFMRLADQATSLRDVVSDLKAAIQTRMSQDDGRQMMQTIQAAIDRLSTRVDTVFHPQK